jgi:hypothetical protein
MCIRDFWGAKPPRPPWVGFAETWVNNDLLRSRETLFASFSGKRRVLLAIRANSLPTSRDSISILIILIRGWFPIAFCEAEQRFLLLFLEKEE